MKSNKLFLFLLLAPALPCCVRGQGLYLSAGVHLVASGAPNLVLNNAGVTNNGQFAPDSSTILFTGDGPAANSFIGGDVPMSFYDIMIRKSSGEVKLNTDIAVAGTIGMVEGNLELNRHMLDLGTSGNISGETNNACITGSAGGTIRRTALLIAPRAINPGNLGVEFTSEADLGWTTIVRGHIQQKDGGIQRFFDITPERNGQCSASLRFFYLEGELAGGSKAELGIFSKDDEAGGWRQLGKESSDEEAGWVAKGDIGKMRRFTLATINMSGMPTRTGARSLLKIAPNPCYGKFRVVLVNGSAGDRVMRLVDASGKLLESKMVHCPVGTSSMEWDTAGIGQGLYYLIVDGMESQAVEILR